MHNGTYGIVLRHLSGNGHKISLLTPHFGKINVLVFDKRSLYRIKVGMLIELHDTRTEGSVLLAKSVSIISMPLAGSNNDFYWTQHLLELCYFFLPVHEPVAEAFLLLQHCLVLATLRHENVSGWEVFKKKVVGIFLIMFGFSPPDEFKDMLYDMRKGLFEFVDFTPEQKVEFVIQHMRKAHCVLMKNFDVWLVRCIQTHPRMQAFKTLSFSYAYI